VIEIKLLSYLAVIFKIKDNLTINFDKVNRRYILALVIYLILGITTLFLLKDYQYPLNPDAISYICISQKYVSGDFSNAVNGDIGGLFFHGYLHPFYFLDLNLYN